MAKNKEISSTEKLLDLIRTGTGGKDESLKPVQDTPPPKKRKPFLWRRPKSPAPSLKPRTPDISSPRDKITVGIDIGYHDIRLTKIAQSPKQKFTLLDFWRVPFDTKTTRDSKEFVELLRPILTKFCGPRKKAQLWCSISSANVEVRHLHIPKVAEEQIAKAVYWTFKKETPFEENKSIFDFEIQGDFQEGDITKTAVIAFVAPRDEVLATKKLFVDSGFPLTGISITPFAIQNLFRTNWIEAGSEITTCNLYVGREWSRIDIFSHGNLAMIRGIKTGVNSMTEEIISGVNKRLAEAESLQLDLETPLTLTLESDATPEEGEKTDEKPKDGLDLGQDSSHKKITEEIARKILFSLSPGSPPLSDLNLNLNLQEDDVFDMIHSVAERLIRQVERTFEHYSSVFGKETVSKIFISGSLDSIKRLVEHIGRQLGVPGGVMDPFIPSLSFAKGVAAPETLGEKIAYVPAIGLALSDNSRTPNFLFTHKDKKKELRVNRLNKMIIGVLICLMGLSVGFAFLQKFQADDKKATLIALRQKLTQQPQVDRQTISELATKVSRKSADTKTYIKKYMGMAVLSELTRLTPDNIFLLNCISRFGTPQEAGSQQRKNTLVLEGIVKGGSQRQDSILTTYLMKIAESPMFSQPSIHKSSSETYDEGSVLYFTVYIEIL